MAPSTCFRRPRLAGEDDCVIAGSRAAAAVPVEQMRQWYLEGDSNLTIALRVDLHQSTVRRVLLEAGVTMRTRREQVALNDARVGVRAPTIDGRRIRR